MQEFNPTGLNFADSSPAPVTGTQTAAPTAAPTTITNADGSTTTTNADGTVTTTPPPNGVTGTGNAATLNETVGGVTSSLNFGTASQIINAALQVVGFNPTDVASTGVNVGQTLTNYFWSQVVGQGITDPTTIGDMVGSLLPSTGQFQVAFPGYQQALAAGYVRTVSEYVSAEEGITAVMIQGGVPKALINPTTVGNLIAGGVSPNEVQARVQNGLDAVENAPAEVQNYFAQEFGANGPTAMATVFLNPQIDDVTLNKMLAGAEIRGAAAASNLTISQGLSQRLADQGQTYASASQAFKGVTAQTGLYEQTVGEAQSQKPIAGTTNANQPLTASNQGVEAAFGLSANAEQQVHQAALARTAEFKGGGGASTTQAEGFSGLAQAKAF